MGKMKEHHSQVIVGALALRDLFSILYYYPDAIDEWRERSLREELVQFIVRATVNKRLKLVMENFRGSDCIINRSRVKNLSSIFVLRVARHPQMDLSDKSEDYITRAMDSVVRKCFEQTSGRLKFIVEELLHIQLHQCLIPRPSDDPSFAEEGRFIQMIYLFWSLCKKVITYQLDHRKYDPVSPMQIMSDLRERIEICFEEISSLVGVTDAQQAFTVLMDIFTSLDWDDPKLMRGEINRIDNFLASVNEAVERLEYPLTNEEEYFIELSNRMVDELHASFDKELNAMPAKETEMVIKPEDVMQSSEPVSFISPEELENIRELLKGGKKTMDMIETEILSNISGKAKEERCKDKEFVTREEIAEILGVAIPTVSGWANYKKGFPEPVASNKRAWVYPCRGVVEWYDKYLRKLRE